MNIKDLSITSLFLLLLLTFLLKWLCLYFDFFGTIDLAIDKTKSKDKKVAIGFFKYFL